MADNPQLSAGTADGAIIATDQVPGTLEHVQLVKLAIAADGSRTLIPADATTGMYVDVRSLSALVAGDAVVGRVKITDGTDVALVTAGGLLQVEASAGTNLNTSTLALEAGGNLAAAATSLAAIDNIVSGTGANISQIGGAAAPIGAGLEATALRVTLPTDGTGKVTAVSGTAANMKVEATLAAAQTLATVTNLAQLGGAAVPIGAGTEAAAVRVTLPTDGTGVVKLGAGTAEIGKLAAGTAAIGKLAANSGVDIGDVDVTSISAGANLVGDVGIQGRTTGGLSMFSTIDLDETEEEVKGSAGTVYGFYIYSNVAAGTKRFVRFYDATAANTTVGTTAAAMVFELDGTQGLTQNIPQGLAFANGICVAATTAVAANDTGAPGANDIVMTVYYK